MITQAPVFVISGPSGVGKTSLVEAFFQRIHPYNYHRCETVTSRRQRHGELASSYNFVSKFTFEKLIMASHFLEYSRTYGDYYGLPNAEINSFVSKADPVAVLDVSGFRKVKEVHSERCYSIFIMPNDFDSLFERLNKREAGESLSSNHDLITRRLSIAKQEIACAGEFDKIIINDTFNRALDEFTKVIESVSRAYYNRI